MPCVLPLIISLLVAAGATMLPAQSVPSGRAPCLVAGLSGDVQCATVEVWEDRDRAAGRRLQLSVIVARATGPTTAPDPILLFAGGPGQASSGMIDFANAAFAPARVRRDLVFVDVRGTGRSAPLHCRIYRTPEQVHGDFYPLPSVRFCRDSLSQGADLTQYITANIADDIDDVRRALGYGPINIYGTSYGSRLALVYARRHPEGVRSMVLKAVAPPDMAAPMSYARDGERALDFLARDCAADNACARAYPGFRAEFRTVIDRARRGELRAPSPRGATTADSIVLTKDVVASTIMGALQSVSSRASIPLAVHRAFAGDATLLARMVQQYRAAIDGGGIAIGMHLSVLCSEDTPRIDAARAAREDANTFLGDSRVRAQVEACREWIPPRVAMSTEGQPVRSRAPVLLLSGELDPNTPARWALHALRTLPNGQHVLLPRVAHSFSSVAECGAGLMAEFFEKGSGRDVGIDCQEKITLPPFTIPEAAR